MSRILLAPLLRWAGKLRYPTLFWVTAALFAVDMVTIDPIPLVDELLLGLATLVLAKWKTRKAPIDVAPR